MTATLLLAFALFAQSPDTFTTLRARSEAHVHAEELRQKSGFCKAASNNMALGDCLGREFKITSANYLAYARTLGALLRLTDEGKRPAGTPQRIPFDDAEAAWLSYRDKTCDVIYQGYQGGHGAAAAQVACSLKLTGNHMRELDAAYSDFH